MTYDLVVRNSESGASATGIVAVIAGLTGLVVLGIAAIRIVDIIRSSESTTPAPIAATTTSTTAVVIGTDSTAEPDFDPSFVFVTDDAGAISVAVPRDWGDVSATEWIVNDVAVGTAVTAAPDIDAWYSTWGTPGAFVGVATSGFAPELGEFSGICTAADIEEWSGSGLLGTLQSWSDCGAERSDFYVFVGDTPDAEYTVLVQLVSIDGSGRETFDKVLATFSYHP